MKLNFPDFHNRASLCQLYIFTPPLWPDCSCAVAVCGSVVHRWAFGEDTPYLLTYRCPAVSDADDEQDFDFILNTVPVDNFPRSDPEPLSPIAVAPHSFDVALRRR